MANIAISDLGVMLFVKELASDAKYKYFLPVKAAPATGSAPNQIEVTEFDSPYHQYILDRQQTPAYDFTYNYSITNFQRAQTYLDGKTTKEFLMLFSNKSAWTFTGVGDTWTDAVSTGSPVNGMISIAVSKKEWISDATTLVDASTIPVDKFNPFAEGNQIQLGVIGNQSVAVGGEITIPVYISPLDATISATSGDITDVTVAVSGANITITGASVGEAIITVTATKDGFVEASQKFVVSVTAA